MTSFVGLDPSAASDLAAHLDEAAADLEAHARTVAGLLAQAGISSSTAPAELQDVASWARYRSRDLRRRISEITAAAGGGPGIHLQGFLFANRAEAVKAGRDEAKNVGGLLRSHDKKKLDAALSDLKRYGDDPSYAAAFFRGLGPARTYALLMATAGRDSAAVVGGALVLARRTGGITVHFIDGIIIAAHKAAAAVQAYTGAIPKELRVQYAQDEYVRRAGSQHPDLVKYLEAIEPLTPYLESGAKVAVIGGAVVIVTGVAACVFLSDGACLGPSIEVLAGSAAIDAQALQELEARFGAEAADLVPASESVPTAAEVLATRDGLSAVEAHLMNPRFLDVEAFGGRGMEPANEEMLRRIAAAAAEGGSLTGADAAFYQHELYENALMTQGIDYETAHLRALADLGHSEPQLYDPEVIRNNPGWFSKPYFDYWGIPWPFSS
jgi:hypothetical protein